MPKAAIPLLSGLFGKVSTLSKKRLSDNFCKTTLIVSAPVRTEKEALAMLNYW